MNIVILGLSITSGWSKHHAITFRGLVRELNKLDHSILFLERNDLVFADNRDLPDPDFCQAAFYDSLPDLKKKYAEHIKDSDLIIIGSNLTDGIEIGEWVTNIARGIKTFYDLDTPVTLSQLKQNSCSYLNAELIPKFDLYLSVSGAPAIEIIEKVYKAPKAKSLYYAFDPGLYFPELAEIKWDLGYLNSYTEGRQKTLEELMFNAAKHWNSGRFVVAGSGYPETMSWPDNTLYVAQLQPSEFRGFYNNQRFTLNVTSPESIDLGYTPGINLFEAAASCTPIISDCWNGLDSMFKEGEEILVAKNYKDTLTYLREICKSERKMIGERARKKVLANHTFTHRAKELIEYVDELITVDSTVSINSIP